MAEIKAIQTEYNGHKFRSRLEARWCVFFDTAKIRYEYEPEGYETEDGTRYLPDFYLPDFDLYVEVKRDTEAGIDEIIKKCEPVVKWGGEIKQILILSDMPGENPDGKRWAFPIYYWSGNSPVWGWWVFWEDFEHDVIHGDISSKMLSSWYAIHGKNDRHICAVSEWSWNDGADEKLRQIERILGYRCDEEIPLTKEEKTRRHKEENVLFYTALKNARQSRFEFGETPKTGYERAKALLGIKD